MKKWLCFLVLVGLLNSCSNDDSVNRCNSLLNVGVNVTINLNLPQFSPLQFISNSVYIPNQGNGGIIVTNVGTSLRAWDAADPNEPVSACSILMINGAEAVSSCTEPNTYSLLTGQIINDDLPCGLKEYPVSSAGDNIFVIAN